MPKRHAFLIGNAVTFSLSDYNVPKAVVRQTLLDFSRRLEGLSEESYDTTAIIDKTSAEAEEIIRDKLRQIRHSADVVMLYYFGHGAVDPENGRLYFITKNAADQCDYPGMLEYDRILRYLVQNKIPRVVIILDCCYAGFVLEGNRHLVTDSFSPQYCALAAVRQEGRALVSYDGKIPVGLFTKHLLSAFDDDAACLPGRRDATWKTIYDFVQKQILAEKGPEPVFLDAGLGSATAFRKDAGLHITDSVRYGVPSKSLYHKLRVLLSAILVARLTTPRAIHRYLQKRAIREFLTPVKDERGISYHTVSEDAIIRYLYVCRILGLIGGDDTLTLTRIGKTLVRQDGARFNSVLHDRVFTVWESYGISQRLLEDTIISRLEGSAIPLLDGVYADLYMSHGLRMPRFLFRVLLDLTAHCGALSCVRDPTYFLSSSFRDALARQ